MAKAAKLKLHCPTCKKLVLATNEDFPFCSDRCRRIDLGKWAMGVYKISSPALDPEQLEANMLEPRHSEEAEGYEHER